MPYDLPPWLTGEQDRGFLAGAQFGANVFQTGERIKSERQRRRFEAEEQPVRMERLKTDAELARQQFDLRAALGPLQVEAATLNNDIAAGQIIKAQLDIDVKKDEAADSTEIKRAQAAWETGYTGYTPQLRTQQGMATWQTWKADTELGKAAVLAEVAAKENQAKLISAGAELLKEGVDAWDYDKDGKRSLIPNATKLQQGFEKVAAKKREAEYKAPKAFEVTLDNGQKVRGVVGAEGGFRVIDEQGDELTKYQLERLIDSKQKRIIDLENEARKKPFEARGIIRVLDEARADLERLTQAKKDTQNAVAQEDNTDNSKVVVEKDGKKFRLPKSQLKEAEGKGYKLVQ